MKKLKKKIIILEISSFVVSVLPLTITILVNLNKYVSCTGDAVKLGFAGVFALIFFIIKAMGKLKMPDNRIVVFGIVFGLSYLTQSVAGDLMLLSGMALLGEMLDFCIFSYQIRVAKEEYQMTKTAKFVSKELKSSQKQANSAKFCEKTENSETNKNEILVGRS